ncbi:hypothetical protein [Allochromatium tepidum]|uniref:hypothetical protein n=1 Tax=Allochromatium tepidum TaxID=553982 RepID=UPI003013A2C1
MNEVAERLADTPEISAVFSVSGNDDVVAVACVACCATPKPEAVRAGGCPRRTRARR